MTNPKSPSALIAEDEPLLAAALQAELARLWPELKIVAMVGDGQTALSQALTLQPDVLLLDIRMPGLSGLDAAAELLDKWNTDGAQPKPFPALVFVTAYDQFAVQAFEAQAIDYLLKPVQTERLQKTVEKLKLNLANRAPPAVNFDATLEQLRGFLTANAAPRSAALKVIQVSVGNAIRMVPVHDVMYFEAADKYLRVLTADHEYLIRTPLKELVTQLDPNAFWQVHRGTLVNTVCIDAVTRDEAGKLSLSLHGRREKLAVSRLYAHLFKAM